MLVELNITDLALIEGAELAFGGGLNCITGETGAGKSLLIDALELLLGQRGKASMLRRGAKRARVEGRFLLERHGYGAAVEAWLREHLPETLEESDTEDDELELILTRTLGDDGRTRAHVNHRPVTQRILRELAARLVEIHGQNDHQRLFLPAEQRALVDTFGEHDGLLATYRERRERWRAAAGRLAGFESGQRDRAERTDLVSFQLRELQELAPDGEERRRLAGERDVLRHAVELGRDLGGLVQQLLEEDGAALERVQRAEHVVEGWSDRIEELRDCADSLREASLHLESAAGGLRSFVDGVEADPERLEELEQRIDAYERLERKHGCDAAGLVQLRERLEAELEELTGAGSSAEELEREVAAARKELEAAAEELRSARRQLRTRLVRATALSLAELGLEHARVDLVVEARTGADEQRFLEDGADEVELFFAANPGESMGPLRAVASGGEIARTMLALRGALAVRHSTPTLVFDEVDAGVGGRLGPKVGAHLAALGTHHQVLCVTHLPAIAALADRHLRVRKEIQDRRTRTVVGELSGEARVDEIADMIAGGAEQETARAEARRLLEGEPTPGVEKAAPAGKTPAGKGRKRSARKARRGS